MVIVEGTLADYKFGRKIGSGSFGEVYKAEHLKTAEMVAIKRVKNAANSWLDACNVREVVVSAAMLHPNTLTLRELIFDTPDIFLVMDLMEGSLQDLIDISNKARITSSGDSRGLASPPLVLNSQICKEIAEQIFSALRYMHAAGIMHRDLKPENILYRKVIHSSSPPPLHSTPVTPAHGNVAVPRASQYRLEVRIADFGLAKKFSTDERTNCGAKRRKTIPPPTAYVATRWYRAPELVLRMANYGPPVDVWAAATLLVECLTGDPLFPGASSEDQLTQIVDVRGSFTGTSLVLNPRARWPDGARMARAAKWSIPSSEPIPLTSIAMGGDPSFLAILDSCLLWDPAKRLTAPQVLANEYFQGNMPGRRTTADVARRTTDIAEDGHLSGYSTDLCNHDAGPANFMDPRIQLEDFLAERPETPRSPELPAGKFDLGNPDGNSATPPPFPLRDNRW